MRIRRAPVLLAVALLMAGILACGFFPATPTVSNIRMATDDTGKTVTSTYAAGDPFFVFADLAGLKSGSIVEARWYAVHAQGIDANSELNTSDYTYDGSVSFIYFELTTPDGSDWPTGSYRVELYLDGTKVGEQGFAVQ